MRKNKRSKRWSRERERRELWQEIIWKSCLYGLPSGILGGLIGCALAAL